MFYLGKKFVDKSMETNEKGVRKTSYFMVRTEDENDNLYEWYVPHKQGYEDCVKFLGTAKKYNSYQVVLEIGAYQGKPRVDFVGMAEK